MGHFRGRLAARVEAAQWFPGATVPGVRDCEGCVSGGWRHGWVGDDGLTIDPGEWVVTVGSRQYVLPDAVFRALCEPCGPEN